MPLERILLICTESCLFEKYSSVLEDEGYANVIKVKDRTEDLRPAIAENPEISLLEWDLSADRSPLAAEVSDVWQFYSPRDFNIDYSADRVKTSP